MIEGSRMYENPRLVLPPSLEHEGNVDADNVRIEVLAVDARRLHADLSSLGLIANSWTQDSGLGPGMTLRK